jgi:hypothetical protein
MGLRARQACLDAGSPGREIGLSSRSLRVRPPSHPPENAPAQANVPGWREGVVSRPLASLEGGLQRRGSGLENRAGAMSAEGSIPSPSAIRFSV